MIKVIVAGTKTSNARATPGGTCSGILIFNASCFSKKQNNSTDNTPMIIPVNKPVAPNSLPATPVKASLAPSTMCEVFVTDNHAAKPTKPGM